MDKNVNLEIGTNMEEYISDKSIEKRSGITNNLTFKFYRSTLFRLYR